MTERLHNSEVTKTLSESERRNTVVNSARPYLNDLQGRIHERPTTAMQEFLARMNAYSHWIDIEQGIIVKNDEDVEKIKDIFRPIYNFRESSIIFHAGDKIVYNKELGLIDFYPANAEGMPITTESHSSIPISPRRAPLPNVKEIEEITRTERTQLNWEAREIKSTTMAAAFGKYCVRWWPAYTGNNSCGRAVHTLLERFGIKNVWIHPRHGNRWQGFLDKDPRFQKVEVNSLSDIPAGAILTYNGKGRLNGRPNGSPMNQKYGHVECMGENRLVYHFDKSPNPGGSAREPQLHNNFAKWCEATGFTWAYIPLDNAKNTPSRRRT